MGYNPSTVWGYLATPNSPFGSIPYVASDNININIDPLNFNYFDANQTPPVGSSILPMQLTVFNGLRTKWTDLTGAPGSGIANTVAGRVALPAGANILTVTNSTVTVSSVVLIQAERIDGTATEFAVGVVLGSFTITANAAATGAVNLRFLVVNGF